MNWLQRLLGDRADEYKSAVETEQLYDSFATNLMARSTTAWRGIRRIHIVPFDEPNRSATCSQCGITGAHLAECPAIASFVGEMPTALPGCAYCGGKATTTNLSGNTVCKGCGAPQ
jgi:hypothetical protein